MRFALSLASVLVLGSAAFADEVAPPPAPATAPATAAPAAQTQAAKKLPLRVVRVLEDTQQALMFDKAKGTHVLVEVGKQIDGFTVTDIDEDSVTLTAEGGQQIVLAGPDPSWRGNGRHGTQKPASKAAAKTATPEDPYAAAAPMDPYGDDGVRTAEAPVAPSATAAPINAGEGGVRTAEAPVAGAPTESVRSAEAPGTPAKVVVTATIPSSTIPTAVASTVAPTSTSPSPSMSTTTTTTTTPSTPIVSAAAPVEAPVAAPSAEPVAPMDNSSSAAWSTTPTPPVDREAAAIASLFADTPPAPTAKPATTAKATKATKKAKDVKIASVSAAGTTAGAALPATAAPSPTDGATIIAKADVTAALGNFSSLASAVRGSFSAAGAHLDAVAPDSLFAKAGLQAGDTITAINNQPLRSLDDAATLYSRAGSMKSATIQVLRAGKPLSLHLAIQ
jgi:hypothetical protein